MKKKIVIGLSVFSLIFILSGVYAIVNIEMTTSKLDNLIRLHQIEILREHLLIEIKRSQTDLYLKDTKYAQSIDTIVSHIHDMDNVIANCFTCHHTETVTKRIDALRSQTERYKDALSRVYTIRSNADRRREEEEAAVNIGMDLVSEVNSITAMTSKKLEGRTRDAFQEIARTKKILYLILACVPILALGLSIVFIRGFTSPLSELLAATRRLKAGNLNYRIRELPDEFGEVAASFNTMAASLKEDFLKMQWAEQLVVLGEMAGGLAHEIKNPLAGIKASMEVLSGDQSVSADNRMVLLKVLEQIRKIEVILKSLLNFARPPKPQFILVDLNSVIDSTVGLAERHPSFSSRDGNPIVIMKDFDTHLPDIMADPLQIQQVFMNLLLNSADAMLEGGTITIRTSAAEDKRSVFIKMVDTGHGIEETAIDKVFQPFYTTKAHGTGLGLAITKGLIEQHAGDIRVENNHDRGVSFTITLPVRQGEEVHSL
jgi:signal transduction histidine kinase